MRQPNDGDVCAAAGYWDALAQAEQKTLRPQQLPRPRTHSLRESSAYILNYKQAKNLIKVVPKYARQGEKADSRRPQDVALGSGGDGRGAGSGVQRQGETLIVGLTRTRTRTRTWHRLWQCQRVCARNVGVAAVALAPQPTRTNAEDDGKVFTFI